MTQKVVTSRADSDIARIASEMSLRNIGSIVIVDNRKVVGILTERDFVRVVELVGTLLHKNLAKHYMTTPVVTVQPDTPIQEVIRLMKAKHIRHIVVIDKKQDVAGVISLRDLMKITSEVMEI